MSEYIKHHFVPQFYLRNFGNASKIALYNIKNRIHVRTASIKGQCEQPKFYGELKEHEVAIGKVEALASPVIKSVLESEDLLEIGERDRLTILSFVLLQRARTPVAGATLNNLHEEIIKNLIRTDPATPSEIVASLDKVKIKIKNPAFFGIGKALYYTPVIFDLAFKVIYNETLVELITSDNPVIFFNQWVDKPGAKTKIGLASSGLEIYLPISPRKAIFLYDSSIYKTDFKSGLRLPINREDDIQTLNTLQLINADENLYYSGSPETAQSIAGLPKEPAIKASISSEINRFDVGRITRVLSLVSEQPPRIKIDLSFIKIIRRKRRVPYAERYNSYRPTAYAIAAAIGEYLKPILKSLKPK